MVNVLASLLWTFVPVAPPSAMAFHAFDDLRANTIEVAPEASAFTNCINVPIELTLDLRTELPSPQFAFGFHRDADGEQSTYEHIARRADRPSDYESYRYPVPRFISWPRVVYGYDLDAPSEQQRHGTLHAVGHGGIDLAQFMGAPVKLVALAQQVGDAEVVYIGPLFGDSVVTRHTLREGETKHDYIVIYGHLSETPKALTLGARVTEGDVIGYVGDSDSPNMVHLHLETRRVREGVSARRLYRDTFLTQSVVTDPRNVLPVASPDPRGSAPCTRSIPLEHFDSMRLIWQEVRQPNLVASGLREK
jgi:murein DD-endopeptidase MepM/ murein hydrolase activator NlpD